MTRREQLVLAFVAAAILIGSGVIIMTRPASEEATLIPSDTVAPAETPQPAEPVAEEPEVEIVVSVQGAVRLPGVYKFDATQRVMDAIEEAGGLGPAANTSTLNLAAKLIDGTTIVVPDAEVETATVSYSAYLLRADTPGNARGTAAAPITPGQRINVNTATQAELETLPGIGPAYAGAIIQRRNQAPFRSIEELLEVRGIGEKRLESMRPLITVE